MTSLALIDASVGQPGLQLGTRAPEFADLLGTDGRNYGTSSFADRDVLVLIFSSNRCPTAKAYVQRMNALQSEYGPRGMQLVAINSNDPHLHPAESYQRMIERADEDGYRFPYIVDDGQRLAKAFGAACTFHVFVLDRDRLLRYQGRFDDSRLEEKVASHDLRDALDEVLAGREVRVPSTRPFGCSLDIT